MSSDKNKRKSKKDDDSKNIKLKSENRTEFDVLDNKEVVNNSCKLEKDENDRAFSLKTSSKSTFNIIEVIIIMVVTTLFGLLLGGIIAYVRIDSRDVSCSGIRKDMVEFSEVYDELLNEYYADVDKDRLMEEAIKGMLDYLKDPYSDYLSKEVSQKLMEELNGSFIGIGVDIVKSSDNLFVISNVYRDSSASKAGILVGDVLVKVGDKSLSMLSVSEVSTLIKNEQQGKKINVTILRDGVEHEFEIERDVVEIDSVYLHYALENDKKIAVISITNFAQNTFSQFKKLYNEALKNGANSLIIDVRNNNGGYLSSASDIASMFLNKGDIIYQKNTKGEVEKVISSTDKEINMDVVLLINGSTASSSEVFVAALKENLNVLVVGVKTYGKGTVQKLHSLSNGSYVKYTVQTWLTPNGNEINGVGIEPTLNVELSEDYYSNPTIENDNQLQKAIELLNK